MKSRPSTVRTAALPLLGLIGLACGCIPAPDNSGADLSRAAVCTEAAVQSIMAVFDAGRTLANAADAGSRSADPSARSADRSASCELSSV